jgi:hypothetical protein
VNITPLKRYRTPQYPIQEVLRTHPELLRLVPKRWADAPLVVSALSLACMILAARDGTGGDTSSNAKAAHKPAPYAKTETARIAPIFHHGEGRGAFGCVSVVAPVFLTEEEARQVITEEASAAGVHFSNVRKAIAGVERPVTYNSELVFDARTREPKVRQSRLMLDGTDPQRNVSFEFVSNQDMKEWEIEEYYGASSSVYEYGGRDAAELLQKGLAKIHADGAVAVFYDPVSTYGRGNQSEAKAREKTVEELRRQARDFVSWLKTQGII